MKNWIKRVVLNGWTDDGNPRAEARGRMGELHEVEVMQPFGISYRPPSGAEAVAMPVNGSNDHLVVVGFTGGTARPMAAEGEIVLYSGATGHVVRMTADGKTRFENGAGWFQIDGDRLTTNLTIETDGDVIAGGVSLRSHRHGGVQLGGAETTGPV